MSDEIAIHLKKSEAMVLFAFLSRFNDDKVLSIVHPAEERVLWNTLSVLENILDEPFAKNYTSLLEKARKQVAAGE
jgi:hypothetical protein